MPILRHNKDYEEATIYLTREDGKRLCWHHPEYPEEKKTSDITTYGVEHKVTEAEAGRLAHPIERGALVVVQPPKKKTTKAATEK